MHLTIIKNMSINDIIIDLNDGIGTSSLEEYKFEKIDNGNWVLTPKD